jgi:hypothetical protein
MTSKGSNQDKGKPRTDVHIVNIGQDEASAARIKHLQEKYGNAEMALASAFDCIHQTCQMGIYKMQEDQVGSDKAALKDAATTVAKAIQFIFTLAGAHLEANDEKCQQAIMAIRALRDDVREQMLGDDDPDLKKPDQNKVTAASKVVEALLAKAGQPASVVPTSFMYQDKGDS